MPNVIWLSKYLKNISQNKEILKSNKEPKGCWTSNPQVRHEK